MKKIIHQPSSKLFQKFGKYMVYSVVDLIILNEKGECLLSKRVISPYKNKWHFPGGVMYKNIPIRKMIKLIAKKEVNLDVKIERFIGTYEIKRPVRHDISHVFAVRAKNCIIKTDFQSSEAKFFKKQPKNMISFQKKILHDAKKLLKSKDKKLNFGMKSI